MGGDFDVSRDRFLNNPRNHTQLLIIGGGINGAAIARDAASRGMSVVLLEKNDFGSGASTKTSKLIHGGLRYLELWEFGLVRESLIEQALLLKNAPHLVHPLPFIYPVYTHDKHPLWKVNLGLYLYDFFARKSRLPPHRKISKQEVLCAYPGIRENGLVGGCQYYDAQMQDNRIVIENVLAAEEAGAIALNYVTVISIQEAGGRVKGVRYRDTLTGREGEIVCDIIVNASGAWTNDVKGMLEKGKAGVRVAPTKGVHLVIPRVSLDKALILHAPRDGRVFFVLPWGDHTLLGTTDTFYHGDPDKVGVDEADIDYLLEAFHHYFTQKQLESSSVVTTFAGLRPLVAMHNDSISPSEVGRNHVIELTREGMMTVLGGKYTTHRKIAQDVVDKVVSQLGIAQKVHPCKTMTTPFPGAVDQEERGRCRQELLSVGLDELQADHLVDHYGRLSMRILEIIREDRKEARQICAGFPHVIAEITYAIKYEHAKNPNDWFARRASVSQSTHVDSIFFQAVADKFAEMF